MRTNELVLYKNMDYEGLLQDMTFLMENCENEYYNKEDLKSLLSECINTLLELCTSHGFEGNLWHTYLTFLLTNDENAYSTACEITGPVEGSVNKIALHDFRIFKELFDYDFSILENALETDYFSILSDYTGCNKRGYIFNRRICDQICSLARSLSAASSAEDFQNILTSFYQKYGSVH